MTILEKVERSIILHQCCLGDLAIKITAAEAGGKQNLECAYNKLFLGKALIDKLKCIEHYLDSECITEADVLRMLDNLSYVCDCVVCASCNNLTDDTVPTILT